MQDRIDAGEYVRRAEAAGMSATGMPLDCCSLQSAPSEVVVEFTEEVEPKFSTIEAHDSTGMRVDNGDVHALPENAKRLA